MIYNYFSRFLHQVHEHSAENKMTADNLALVFGPNILSPEVRTYFVHTCLADHGILDPFFPDPFFPMGITDPFFPMDNRSWLAKTLRAFYAYFRGVNVVRHAQTIISLHFGFFQSSEKADIFV